MRKPSPISMVSGVSPSSTIRTPNSPGGASEQPSVTLRYDIDSSGKRPYSIITTRAADGLTTSETSARESAAFVDGLGRVVVTLEQADPTAGDGGSYIATGLTDYDQKGSPRRQFLPWFTNQSASTFSLASPPPTASKATVFDAFGRTIRTVDFDGIVEAERHYHALSTDSWDRADLSSAQHRGTYQTVVHDGHGRTRIAIDRLREGGGIQAYSSCRWTSRG